METNTNKRRLSCYHQLHDEKKSRYLFTFSVTICIVTIIYFGKICGLMMNECVAIIMCILALHFLILFLIVISGFDALHLIRVKRRRSSHSSTLFIPYGIDQDETRPMDSVSAVIGLRGSNSEQIANSLILSYGAMAFVTSLTDMMNNPHHAMGKDSNIHNSSTCLMVACLGGWLLCNFCLEHESFIHDAIHLVGAGLFIICSLIGYGLQQDYSSCSTFLISTSIMFGSLWVSLKFIRFQDLKHVHYQSVFMIGFETVVIVCCMTANIMQIWSLKYSSSN